MVVYTDELNNILYRQLPHSYAGCWSIDTIPARKSGCFILNTDNSEERGSHWLAICFPPNAAQQYALFIDPLGWPHHLLNRRLRAYFTSIPVKVMPFSIQALTSECCGQFCAFILSHLPLYDYNLDWLIETTFSSSNLRGNDSIVKSWWNVVESA